MARLLHFSVLLLWILACNCVRNRNPLDDITNRYTTSSGRQPLFTLEQQQKPKQRRQQRRENDWENSPLMVETNNRNESDDEVWDEENDLKKNNVRQKKATTVCGELKVENMGRLSYSSSLDGAQQKSIYIARYPLPIDPTPIEHRGEVFIGYTKDFAETDQWQRTGGTSRNNYFENDQNATFGSRCVIISIVEEEMEIFYIKNEAETLKRIGQRLVKSKRRHIIDILDFGETLNQKTSEGQFLSVVELGRENLEDSMYRNGIYFQDEEDFGKMIKQVVTPIREFHQVAVHLDVKPRSFVYVKDGDEIEVLKIADALNAKFISNARNGANSPLAMENHPMKSTHMYQSPEMRENPNKVTVKADIWSFGIMVYELFLLHKQNVLQHEYASGHFGQLHFMRNLQDRINKRLWAISTLYRGFVLRDENVNRLHIDDEQMSQGVIEFGYPKWIHTYWNAILDVLSLWRFFPRIALLVTNLLDLDHERRLTANGIVDFLRGKCYPADLDENLAEDQIKLFNEVKVGDLEEKIREKVRRTNELIRSLNEDRGYAQDRLEKLDRYKRILTRWALLKTRLNDAVKKRQMFVGALRGRDARVTEHCDTQSTQMELNSRAEEEMDEKTRDRLQKWEGLAQEIERHEQMEAQGRLGTKPAFRKGPGETWELGQLKLVAQRYIEMAKNDESIPDTPRKTREAAIKKPILDGKTKETLRKWEKIRRDIEECEQAQLQGELEQMPVYRSTNKTWDIDELKYEATRLIDAINSGINEPIPDAPAFIKSALIKKSEEQIGEERLREWQKIREDVKYYEQLHRHGELAKLPVYRREDGAKWEMGALKRAAAGYIEMLERGQYNVPDAPELAQNAVLSQKNNGSFGHTNDADEAQKLRQWEELGEDIEFYEKMQALGKLSEMPYYRKETGGYWRSSLLRRNALQYVTALKSGNINVPNAPAMAKEPVCNVNISAKMGQRLQNWRQVKESIERNEARGSLSGVPVYRNGGQGVWDPQELKRSAHRWITRIRCGDSGNSVPDAPELGGPVDSQRLNGRERDGQRGQGQIAGNPGRSPRLQSKRNQGAPINATFNGYGSAETEDSAEGEQY